MSSLREEIAGELRDARKKAGLTQEQLAAKLGLSQSYIARMEQGEVRVDIDLLESWGQACGLAPVIFFESVDVNLKRKVQKGTNAARRQAILDAMAKAQQA